MVEEDMSEVVDCKVRGRRKDKRRPRKVANYQQNPNIGARSFSSLAVHPDLSLSGSLGVAFHTCLHALASEHYALLYTVSQTPGAWHWCGWGEDVDLTGCHPLLGRRLAERP